MHFYQTRQIYTLTDDCHLVMLIEFYKMMAVSKTVNCIFIIKRRPLCIVETILLKFGENYFLNEKNALSFIAI